MLHPRSDWLQAEATTWPGGTTTAYDALDRVTAVTAPNGVTTKTAYNADRSSYTYVDATSVADRMLRWTRQDGLGNTDVAATFNRVNNSWGWDASVLLAYDLTGNLTQVTNVAEGAPANKLTEMTYDKAGHKLGLEDPNLGNWQYAYDRQGRLTAQVDARGKRTCLFYDGMERLAAKQFTTGGCPSPPPAAGTAGTIRYTYGTVESSTGQLIGVTRTGDDGSAWSTRALTYDPVGRVMTDTVTLAGRAGAVATGYRYDAYNRPNLTIYPDGEQLTLEYNSMGLPARLTSSTQGVLVNGLAVGGASAYTVQYDAAGRAVKTKYAAGGDLWRTQTFAPFTQATQGGLLTAIDVGTQAAPGALLHLGYVYDEFGNTTTITETTTANVLSYDGQNRVTGAFGATYSYQPSGRFDRFVGLTFAYGTGQAAGSNRAPLHGVVSTAAGGAFAYDLAGNMVSRRTTSAAPVQTLAWSPANELLSVTTGATVESYRYDADSARIYQEARTSGALSWQQFDYFPHYTVGITATQAITKTYFFAGRPIAQRVGGRPLTYLHADHLGSTVLTTGVTGSQKYHAYGATRSGLVKTEHQFTGHETDSTGLIYMQARYYDPVVGQFISPDTLVPDPTNVYAYNRYMYAYGNPLRYTDPTGHYADEAIMEHFDCKDWACVEDNFEAGGMLEGLWGWLDILRGAEDGHAVELYSQSGTGTSVQHNLVTGIFQTIAGIISVANVQAQVDRFSSQAGSFWYDEPINSNEFATLARMGSNTKSHSAFYVDRSGGGRAAVYDYRYLDCIHDDCVARTINSASVATSAVALGCAATMFAPCTLAAGITGRALTVAGVGWTIYQAGVGEADALDVAVAVGAGTISWRGSPGVSLAADVFQWRWDIFREE